jgi:membrane-bound inhibitor of C-type lysozyme
MKKQKILIISVVILILLVPFIFFAFQIKNKDTAQNDAQKKTASARNIIAVYECPNNTFIGAVFHLPEDTVDISLSDGRKLTLPRAISASGARYANSDESFVFWNKGDTAFIEEGNATTYQDCVDNSSS